MFFSMEGAVIQFTEDSVITNIAMYGLQNYEDMELPCLVAARVAICCNWVEYQASEGVHS